MAFDPTNNQSVFDRVLAHCRKQKVAAWNQEEARYEYRTADGKKCAVGCLIGTRDYDRHFEGQSVHPDFDRPLERLLTAKGFDLYLLEELQRAHDSGMPRQGIAEPDILERMGLFEATMRVVAEHWNLRYTRP